MTDQICHELHRPDRMVTLKWKTPKKKTVKINLTNKQRAAWARAHYELHHGTNDKPPLDAANTATPPLDATPLAPPSEPVVQSPSPHLAPKALFASPLNGAAISEDEDGLLYTSRLGEEEGEDALLYNRSRPRDASRLGADPDGPPLLSTDPCSSAPGGKAPEQVRRGVGGCTSSLPQKLHPLYTSEVAPRCTPSTPGFKS